MAAPRPQDLARGGGERPAFDQDAELARESPHRGQSLAVRSKGPALARSDAKGGFPPEPEAPSNPLRLGPSTKREVHIEYYPFVWFPRHIYGDFGTATAAHAIQKPMSFLHKYFLEQNLLEIHDIRKKRGAAVDLSETFVIWHAPDPSQLLHFLLASRKDPVIFGKRSKDLAGHYCPVLVERTQGRPLGKHLAHLCGDRLPYKNGMIIQSFGAQNLNPCSGCIRRFTSTYKLASDGTPIYMQTPFDSCVSLPGTVGSDAVCGNCEWHGTRQECEYGSDRRVVGPPETMGDLARICSWQGKYATKPALDVLRCGIPERNWITRRNIPGGAFEYGGKLSPAPIVPKA